MALGNDKTLPRKEESLQLILKTELRLFFLDETDVRNYYTSDHRENVVQPMRQTGKSFSGQRITKQKLSNH